MCLKSLQMKITFRKNTKLHLPTKVFLCLSHLTKVCAVVSILRSLKMSNLKLPKIVKITRYLSYSDLRSRRKRREWTPETLPRLVSQRSSGSAFSSQLRSSFIYRPSSTFLRKVNQTAEEHKMDSIHIIYNHFKSLISSVPTTIEIAAKE